MHFCITSALHRHYCRCQSDRPREHLNDLTQSNFIQEDKMAWRKKLLLIVICLLVQCYSSVQASQSCSSSATLCEFVCSAIECEMYFQCSTRNKTSYTPTSQGLTYCCPGYFKTSTGSCQVCPDKKFMRYVNNCGYCLDCSDCDSTLNDTIKYSCNGTRNTVCHIKNDLTPSPGSVCPTVDVTSSQMSTIPSEMGTTGSGDPISPTGDGPQKSTGKSYWSGMITFAYLFVVMTVIILIIILLCAFLRYRAGSNRDQYALVQIECSNRDQYAVVQNGVQIDAGQNNNWEQRRRNLLDLFAEKMFIVQKLSN